ncbi:MAG: sulfatase-like hydrolase/transferase [Rhodopseudomonas sp.]|nr:sulfatase-like hydrolase/transferase [Rhodopseudomonas sp.]
MAEPRNILFIMCDQLRTDYLSCYGHPTLKTPNIDALASRGVRFTRAYVQSPICGPSRMSTYTGRYVAAHGSTWNGVPLKVGEYTIGDYLRPLGLRVAVVGKTHMTPDVEGMARLGINPESMIGVHVSQCGFEPYERFDGVHPRGTPQSPNYNAYLQAKGYTGTNPWDSWAAGAEDDEGHVVSAFFMRHADKPARVKEEDSETVFTTDRAIDFITETGAAPWCLHVSYIKPHWPYIAPAPYHSLYGAADVVPPIRATDERIDPHPIYKSFMNERVSRAFADDKVRNTVIPAYMGLVKQIDDEVGRLLEFLKASGRLDDTLIVFTSDHGDYLGDHWLGEKELFHDVSVRVPLIVVDPSGAADATRGQVSDRLVEMIDLVPTFVDCLGAEVQHHRLDGVSLLPILHGEPQTDWRSFIVSEYDYSLRLARVDYDVPLRDCYLTMLADERWSYVHAPGFPPMLFDRVNDPHEFIDLGRNPAFAEICAMMKQRLFGWAMRQRQRTTISDAALLQRFGKEASAGILIGFWDESEPRDYI